MGVFNNATSKDGKVQQSGTHLKDLKSPLTDKKGGKKK